VVQEFGGGVPHWSYSKSPLDGIERPTIWLFFPVSCQIRIG
jgi:hypothetical protein